MISRPKGFIQKDRYTHKELGRKYRTEPSDRRKNGHSKNPVLFQPLQQTNII